METTKIWRVKNSGKHYHFTHYAAARFFAQTTEGSSKPYQVKK